MQRVQENLERLLEFFCLSGMQQYEYNFVANLKRISSSAALGEWPGAVLYPEKTVSLNDEIDGLKIIS